MTEFPCETIGIEYEDVCPFFGKGADEVAAFQTCYIRGSLLGHQAPFVPMDCCRKLHLPAQLGR